MSINKKQLKKILKTKGQPGSLINAYKLAEEKLSKKKTSKKSKKVLSTI